MASSVIYGARKYFRKKDNIRILLMLVPGLVVMGMFTFYPIIKMFVMSFFDWKIGYNQVSPFVGIKNYLAVFSDPITGMALANTMFYAVVTVPSQMILGLIAALLINGIRKFSITFRLLYYLPVITSWVVVALLFRYIFSNQGLLNYLLTDVFKWIPEYIGWLSTRWPAMTAMTLLGIWKGIGWNMVIFLAALQAVPEEYYEAASIDGAGSTQKFFYITLPNIKGTILFCTVMLTIGAFNTFTPIAVITGGNPAHQTEVVLTWTYYQTFSSFKMGYAAALSFVVAAIVAGIAVILFRVLRPERM
ncbi:MAG TPA: sugar ABC transporter permease [Candidatus Atribacteria bacterium]|nr:MAG: sugar ABC transporter permease [Candidatus Nealsonbacteria bacterium]HDK27462.1 sugar ABC transporter permease [Candidatus Atribacteria bacterium]